MLDVTRFSIPAIVGLVTLELVSCSSHPVATEICPQDLPAACPSNAPSYQLDVAPIFTSRCAICHSPIGSDPQRDYTNYSAIYANRGAILDQVYACNMPPSGASAPSPSERTTLLSWLVCGAPDN
jgi:hypothetical protein